MAFCPGSGTNNNGSQKIFTLQRYFGSHSSCVDDQPNLFFIGFSEKFYWPGNFLSQLKRHWSAEIFTHTQAYHPLLVKGAVHLWLYRVIQVAKAKAKFRALKTDENGFGKYPPRSNVWGSFFVLIWKIYSQCSRNISKDI